MKAAVTLTLALVLLAYPLLVYWGLGHLEPRVLALALLVLVGLRVALLKGASAEHWQRLLPLAGAVGVTAVLVIVSNSPRLLLLNPSLISLVFLGFFAYTLYHPPPMIERFARLQSPRLSPSAQRYCRRVTLVWCGFFVVNGGLSLWTALQQSVGDPLQVWTLYNGLLSYLLMGLLGGTEYLIRRRKLPAFERELAAMPEVPR